VGKRTGGEGGGGSGWGGGGRGQVPFHALNQLITDSSLYAGPELAHDGQGGSQLKGSPQRLCAVVLKGQFVSLK
jgi:hypothetical protein